MSMSKDVEAALANLKRLAESGKEICQSDKKGSYDDPYTTQGRYAAIVGWAASVLTSLEGIVSLSSTSYLKQINIQLLALGVYRHDCHVHASVILSTLNNIIYDFENGLLSSLRDH